MTLRGKVRDDVSFGNVNVTLGENVALPTYEFIHFKSVKLDNNREVSEFRQIYFKIKLIDFGSLMSVQFSLLIS